MKVLGILFFVLGVVAEAATVHVEEFELTRAVDKIDLLFVIDDSGSMDSYQKKLAANIPQIVASIPQEYDVNVGIVTTSAQPGSSSTCCGQMVALLNSKQPGFANELANRLLVGISGDGIERPIDAAIAALTSPMIDTVNKGFLRTDSAVVVYFVTDAFDQSDRSAFALLQAAGANRGGNVIVSGAIIPAEEINPSCQRDSMGGPLQGVLDGLIAQTGGQRLDLCQSDFASQLQVDAGVAGKTYRPVEFTLSRKAVPGSIKVEVDGIGAAGLGWVLSAGRTLVFPAAFKSYVVPEGTKLKVTYEEI